MGKFTNGFWLGLGGSLLLAPMSGQDTRVFLKERLQYLRNNLPKGKPLTQSTQPLQKTAHNPLATEPTSAPLPEAAPQEHPLQQVTGMNEQLRENIQAQGISSIEQLIKSTANKEERTQLAQNIGITAQQLKTLVNYADLSHINGIGEHEAILLEEAGVNGSKDLQQRNPEHLHTKLLEVQRSRHLIDYTPDLEQVATWIAEAVETTAHESL